MATQFERFVSTMQKVLMLDQADLDFGIYRIMNQKRTEIERYLNNDLKNHVASAINMNASETSSALAQQLQTAIEQANALGVDPDSLPKVQQIRQQIAQNGNSEDLENEVYSHLTTFFSRYYDGGDYISQRRYKKDVYAIPYEGEEVKLYWANADQYYIKTGEYFRNYRFALDDNKYCEFTLKEASVEQNNNLAQNNLERRFAIYENCPVEVIGNTLHINFTYELMPKATKQKQLIEKAYEAIKNQMPSDYALALFALRPTEADNNRTLLQKHLNDYVARNTFDYFIHKDLNGFLTRELDFYIKNEILEIDDINARSTEDFVKHLTIIKAIKTVGTKLITFLASLEDYQKRLWLKKKFVVQCDYCITLDRVPESLYDKICTNEAQREEWIRLFAIDEIKGFMGTDGYSIPLSIDFLKNNPFLVLDTKFFDAKFKHKLLASIDNFDEQCDGLLINSENFQALGLLKEKYNKQINCVYIDPPYNTDATPILYKNGYKDSTWMTLINDRVNISRCLNTCDGYHSIAIDDAELHNLYKLLEQVFIGCDLFQCIVNHYPGSGTGRSNISKTHEYNIFTLSKGVDLFRGKPIQERERTRGFCRSGTGDNNYRHGRPNSFYAVLVDNITKQIKGVDPPPSPEDNTYKRDQTEQGYLRIYPLGEDGSERCWSLGYESAQKAISEGMLECTKNNIIKRLYNDEADWELLPSLWVDSKYSAVTNGTNLLTKLFEKSGLFSFPKSIYTVMTAIYAGTYNKLDAFVLDYFAGSGTTGHAVINLNREDGGHRKYILCEMGEYFDTVTKPRIQKVIYSKDWNGGKPVSREGSSHCFKYMRLEQYEDTLNNLVVKSANIDTSNEEFYGGYMLGYLLDTETRDSLFNLQWFRNPWNIKLKITRQNEQKEESVDVIETFNYLLGLNVNSYNYPKPGIATIEGVTRSGEKTLVIWRDCEKISNEELNRFFEKMAYSTRDTEFDRIYVNGDNNLENLRTEEEQWKVLLIEEEFAKRMFEDCE